MAETSYVVLRAASAVTDDNPNADWRELEVRETATTAAGAIRAAVAQLPESVQAGTYVAIPARSFKPVTVRAEQTVVLKLEDAAG